MPSCSISSLPENDETARQTEKEAGNDGRRSYGQGFLHLLSNPIESDAGRRPRKLSRNGTASQQFLSPFPLVLFFQPFFQSERFKWNALISANRQLFHQRRRILVQTNPNATKAHSSETSVSLFFDIKYFHHRKRRSFVFTFLKNKK